MRGVDNSCFDSSMGIKGLHKALEDFSREGHVSMFVGEKVAVDAYAWLHKVRKRPGACMLRGTRQQISPSPRTNGLKWDTAPPTAD